MEDQPDHLPSGKLTQNGLFVKAVIDLKHGLIPPEIVKVYEKIMNGVWSLKGYFNLIDYKVVDSNGRKVFRFVLQLSDKQKVEVSEGDQSFIQTRLIPSEVKMEVWKRDNGMCVLCGVKENLHFDHELPYSKGGTSLTIKNVRLLCVKHNLQKSGKIE